MSAAKPYREGERVLYADCEVVVLADEKVGDGLVSLWNETVKRREVVRSADLCRIPAPPLPSRLVWEYTHLEEKSARLTALLEQGWEPFAVTVAPEKMREHQSEGHCTYFDHVVWLKRLKTA